MANTAVELDLSSKLLPNDVHHDVHRQHEDTNQESADMGVLRWLVLRKAISVCPPYPSIATLSVSRPLTTAVENSNLVFRLRESQNVDSNRPLFHVPTSVQDSQISYGRFWTLVGRYARCLRGLGLNTGDRLAAQISKSPESLALYYAVLQIGGIYLPLNSDYTVEEIRYFLSSAEPLIFICQDPNLKSYNEAGFTSKGGNHSNSNLKIIAENAIWKLAVDCKPDLEVVSSREDDVACICYTSGTTGKPKGAMITHGNLVSNAETLCKAWRIEKSDVLLHALPIYHVHGLMVALNPLLMVGAKIIFLPRFEMDQVLRWLPSSTLMMGVPTYYSRLLSQTDFGPEMTKNCRLFISGSAPLLASVWEEFRVKSGGHRILERYGMTEGQMVCSNPYEGERKPGTVGPPLPGIEVRVRNGILEYRGPNLFKGYWRMPDKTKADFTDDGFFISGDLAEIDSKNGYVTIMGRGKDLIISGGLNVYPKEIEDVLDQCPGVQESAVIGVEHRDFGEAVVAVVIPKDDANPPSEAQVIAYAKERVAGFKCPKRVFSINALPRNVMGKVQKNELREQYKNLFDKP